MVQQKNICVKIGPYTNKVLGVVKEKYGLKDKGEALDRFAEMYGNEFVEKEIHEEVIAEAIQISQQHIRKHGLRKMSEMELDKLFKR